MKTVRLETVFSSFQKQGCFCGFHRFLYLIPADIMLFLLVSVLQTVLVWQSVLLLLSHMPPAVQ